MVAAPVVEVPVPGADTVAPLGFEVPLVADVRDDHGVTAVTLQSRRTPRTGGVGPVVSQPLELPAGAADRVFLSTRLDLKALGLEPGDTLRYWVVARDNSPAGQVGQSREFLLVLPTASEARAEQRESVGALAKRLDSLVAESGKLQHNTEDLSRERPHGATPAERPDPTMSFDEAKKAEALAHNQQDLVQ